MLFRFLSIRKLMNQKELSHEMFGTHIRENQRIHAQTISGEYLTKVMSIMYPLSLFLSLEYRLLLHM